MKLIEAENIHKKYAMPHKTIDVLSGANLSVDEGETVSVIGVSGAGKSTLLHILGGLDQPDDGCVRIDGCDLYGSAARVRTRIRADKIGFVFQSYHLLPEMDVLENVMLPAMAKRGAFSARKNLRSRALDLLSRVGLAERSSHTPLELSGGEQQRVALARALMNDPQVVLADEPTGNLDEGTGGQVLKCLFDLTRERGHSLVLVTHNEHTASMCDRVLRLDSGLLN